MEREDKGDRIGTSLHRARQHCTFTKHYTKYGPGGRRENIT